MTLCVSEIVDVGSMNVTDRSLSRRKKAHRSTASEKYTKPGKFDCINCEKTYRWYTGLLKHLQHGCGRALSLGCPYCSYTAKDRRRIYSHIETQHRSQALNVLDVQQGF